MRFQVPQFIDTETRLVGPFTLKQFLWIASGAVLVFLLNFFLSPGYLIAAGVIIMLIAVAFAYAKIEGMSLVSYLIKALVYMLSSKRYLFTKSGNEETSVLDEYKGSGKS